MKKAENAFDALKRIDELEKENQKLKNENKILRFENMSEMEKEWAMRAYRVLKWKDGEFINSKESFKRSYIDQKDDELNIDAVLPFI